MQKRRICVRLKSSSNRRRLTDINFVIGFILLSVLRRAKAFHESIDAEFPAVFHLIFNFAIYYYLFAFVLNLYYFFSYSEFLFVSHA
ncbi:hypothetical protein CLOSYM_04428 [[Clostridium] symbiosum ATCC 14940]|uniref:Uncharacterized protein n=1 Tax=[Clostridium] symbiosum ATCC 14940 TaxID=411472 RepID=A0ABC9TRP0_CLOSY|nr:hypothetical protein CLOSYM_04428 [[Clostridium] symbiosum ATCC 14940]